MIRYYFSLSDTYERRKINEMSSKMEVTTFATPAVNYHYNLSSKLKPVKLPPKNLWVFCKGLWQKKPTPNTLFCVVYYNIDHIR